MNQELQWGQMWPCPKLVRSAWLGILLLSPRWVVGSDDHIRQTSDLLARRMHRTPWILPMGGR